LSDVAGISTPGQPGAEVKNVSRPARIAVVIPAYNEAESIASVVAAVNALKLEEAVLSPVVVNDCSTDATAEVISRLPCVGLHLPINLGIGGAVQTGLKYAFRNQFDLAIQIDGDGQHPPRYIPLLFEQLRRNGWDVAIGSRFIDKEGFQSTLLRRWGIQFLQWLLKAVSGGVVLDPTSGMRLMNRRAMKMLCDFYPDEYPEPEAIILYTRHGLKFGEVPVEMSERLGGQSSIQGFHSLYYMFKVSIAIIFTYLRR
jgi:glycosyltransferase involved in cell wall biosynthesis